MRHFWKDVSNDEIVCLKCRAVVRRTPGVKVPLRRVSQRMYNGEVVRNLPTCKPELNIAELNKLGIAGYARKHGYDVAMLQGIVQELGIKISRTHTFSEKERSFIQWVWGEYVVETVLRKLNEKFGMDRTLRQLLVYVRKTPGLGAHIPRGCESLSRAAQRHSMHRGTLLTILHAAGVPVKRAAPSEQLGLKPSKHRYVDSALVDAAVIDFLEAESVYHACSRGKVDRARLLRALASMGHVPPPKSRRWRLPKEVMDKALEIVRNTPRLAGERPRRAPRQRQQTPSASEESPR